jgi:hypothetical protein
MLVNALSNQFIFQFPVNFIEKDIQDKYQKYLENNNMPYDNILDYINSTIKEVIFPNLSFSSPDMTLIRSKKIEWKESGHLFDKFQNELDITFKSVDSYSNYFMMLDILTNYYQNNRKQYIDFFLLQILDKYGNLLYTVSFKDIVLKSISEVRLGYNIQETSEKTFTITYRYNWIDIIWEMKNDQSDIPKSIFDIPKYKGNKEISSDISDIK